MTQIIVSGLFVGAVIAFGLNFLLTRKIENRGQRIGMRIGAYVIFILLGLVFSFVYSLRDVLDGFVGNRINDIETVLSERFPNVDIMKARFDTSELVLLNDELQQSIRSIDISESGILERLILDAFIGEITRYTSTVDSGVAALSAISDDGSVTIRGVLYAVKDVALDRVSPFILILQRLIVVLLIICIGIYAVVALFFIKGGGKYNKSIVYEDNNG